MNKPIPCYVPCFTPYARKSDEKVILILPTIDGVMVNVELSHERAMRLALDLNTIAGLVLAEAKSKTD